ncbi:LysM peptidoglycan-binding domain-containing M23 family metallopeptidase [Streptomyces sp. MST-110588]|uniref:LysM peptidoglycan-binding domain-containing M23 family metallopeptidase n=1 Tax=Streptomyces sp. MST-110588 TaxID=2833628 RepID=UPI001F5C6556|nr:LysM peptidoglycan-binding domain-containing M23 family metallopeptidase [Streptomyces sp. MST-110588]UNO42619.1 peptidoglycan DD-metalloendopeptidase family protein [Streptomyces sp. MST-110588]
MVFSPTGRHRAPRRRGGAGRLLTRASTAVATLALPVVGASAASALGGGGTYTVAPGDSLSGIAAKQGVKGGWAALYERNRSVVGGDPDLIKVGVKLKLGGKAAAPGQRAARTAERPSVHRADAGWTAVRPVSGGSLTAGFGASGGRWAHGHTGQDFAVPVGTPVRAARGGTVVKAGWGGAFGYEIVIRHHRGSYTHYAHLSQIRVGEGQAVATGERVGRSGATGNVTGPHLHFEVRSTPYYGSAVNPMAWLRRHGA